MLQVILEGKREMMLEGCLTKILGRPPVLKPSAA